MFNADQYWITVAEVKGFTKAAKSALSEQELDALIELLSLNPTIGDVIPDTNGVRFLPFPAKSQGRNGRVRIIYYFRDLNAPVYLLALYGKGERMHLTATHKGLIRELVDELVNTYRIKWADNDAAQTGAA